MKTYKTFLPIFPGFYNTLFEPDENIEIDCINEDRQSKGLKELNFDYFIFDYDEYYNEIGYKCTEVIENTLKDILKNDISIKFEKIISPKYYNYSNDSINVEISLNKDDIFSYLLNNYDDFKEYIKEKYSSRSGFISWFSNDANDWIKDFADDFEMDHKIGSILEFIILNDDYDYNLYDKIDDLPMLYCKNYDELINS